ncbi:MAG: BPL-N domain-containing protein [Desulfobulbaceae bacterium]
MKTSSRSESRNGCVAFLWDESFLWGVMAHKALRAAGLPFELIRAEDIRNGVLADYGTLFVPGGWASNKAKTLGEEGITAIRKYVDQGGNYIGFCGGAGLVTQDGIGLLPVTRRPTKERVPSFSGRIRLNVQNHDLWKLIDKPIYHAWWPSQFVVDQSVTVLATYGEALPDAFTSDVNVGDGLSIGGWEDLEAVYQINLDPQRLIGEPALVEGKYGKGTVLLSLVHFDTPEDGNGAAVLGNMWRYFGCATNCQDAIELRPQARSGADPLSDSGMVDTQAAIDGLIGLGLRNFLWFWRNSMLLQWRRGVRGLEYCTLSVLVHEVVTLLERGVDLSAMPGMVQRIQRIRIMAQPFAAKAGELLLRERRAMQKEHITYERCQDPKIVLLRDELFSRSKSYGGFFKELIDEIDHLLYQLLIGKRGTQ